MSFDLDFVGIGAARCGTTWIARCIEEHPELFLPEKKEIHFFDNDDRYNRRIKLYKEHFAENTDNLLQGEFSPRYMLYKKALERIKNEFSNVKIIISLRNPLERAISQYCYFRFNKKKEDKKDFREALTSYYQEDYLEKSMYAEQMKNVFKYFDKEQILILLYDNIQNKPAETVKKIYDFLDVDASFRPSILNKTINKSKINYYDPPKIWARFAKIVFNSRDRIVGGDVIQEPILNSKLATKIFGHSIIRRLVRFINKKLDIHLGKDNKSKVVLSQEDKKILYNKHFKSEINYLEEKLGIDLSAWKYK